MKVSIDTRQFREALTDVFSVTPSITPKEILRNIRVIARGEGELELLATDLSIGLRKKIVGVRVDEPGETILSPRVLQIAKLSENPEIYIASDDPMIRIETGKSKYRFATELVEHFPDIPSFPEDKPFLAIAGADLKRLIRRTSFCVDLNSTRYALGGCLIECTDGNLSFIGTDGRRLALASAPCRWEGGESESIKSPILSFPAMRLLLKILGDDEARINIDPLHSATVAINGSILFSRLVEGRFPAWRGVLPGSPTAIATVTVGPLLKALEQASITTNDDSRGVTLKFSEGSLELHAATVDVGESCVITELAYQGDPIEILVDGRYMLDGLKVLDPNQMIEVRLIDAKNALVIAADHDFLFVIMPLTREQ